ncbi:hypothetical protein [Blastococcus sp. TF02A-26]|uniref:hypothetical protein n=1 Tax=Blastococcus sp. TF02A-26 TaxID=2250577 RepID=UPI0011BDFBD4|nr:hypothetical protein [Blastococcus sp. TF02A-26]
MYRVRRVLRFMREHKFTTSFLGTALGGALINIGLVAQGATIGMLAAMWGVLGLLGLFSGGGGTAPYQPGVTRINGQNYATGSFEAHMARQTQTH